MNPTTESGHAESANAREAARQAGFGSPSLVEYISFCIGDDQYGVPIISVREIKGWSSVNPLPNQPEFVRGVLNLRGNMVPIIDLRRRFSGQMTDAGPMHVVIIVQIEGMLAGLLADRVLDIVSFEESKIQPVPNTARGSEKNFVSGLITIDAAMIALIDLSTLLPARERGALHAQPAA